VIVSGANNLSMTAWKGDQSPMGAWLLPAALVFSEILCVLPAFFKRLIQFVGHVTALQVFYFPPRPQQPKIEVGKAVKPLFYVVIAGINFFW
jgi:hypothetical protein